MAKIILVADTTVTIQGKGLPAQSYNLRKNVEVGTMVPAKNPLTGDLMLETVSHGINIYFTMQDATIQDDATPIAPAPIAPAPAPVPDMQLTPTSARETHVGHIGDRVQIRVRVNNIRTVQTNYGERLVISTTVIPTNHVVQWWSGSTNIRRNDEVVVRGTVNIQNWYRDIPQTTLNRVQIVTQAEETAPNTSAPSGNGRRPTGVDATGAEVEWRDGVTQTEVEIAQAEADRQFDAEHKPIIDEKAIEVLCPYILTYDIPDYSNYSPVSRLQGIGYHLQGSVWVVNCADLPWSLIDFMRRLGADVQYYEFSSLEGKRLVRTAVRTLIKDIKAERKNADDLIRSNTERMIRNVTETGMSDEDALASQLASSKSAQRRLKKLEADLVTTCARFGIDPVSLKVSSLSGISESIRDGMAERASAFVRALARLRALGTVTGTGLAAAMEGRNDTDTILAAADYLNESESGLGDELQKAFQAPSEESEEESSDDSYDLDTDNDF